MSISLDGAREKLVPPLPNAPPAIFVECSEAVWTYRYFNGYIVTLRGVLNARLVQVPSLQPNSPPVLKFESLTFDSNKHEKFLKVESIVRDPPKTPRMKNESPVMGAPKDEEKIVIERATIPAEPVNAFGIPQATMRCLEVPSLFTCGFSSILTLLFAQLAESVGAMSELMTFAIKTRTGPKGLHFMNN